MIGLRTQSISRRLAERAVRPLAAVGVTPLMLTVAGFLVSIPAAALFANDQSRVGGICMLVAGALDVFDGALARVRRQVTVFGAFIDSTLDRYVALAIYGGLIWKFAVADQSLQVIATFAAAAGCVLVSYTKARAEGLGLDCKVGFLQRPERLIILGVSAIISGWLLEYAIWILAIGTQITAIQRIWHISTSTRRESIEPDGS